MVVILNFIFSDGYSPAVRSLLELYALDGSKIEGTGKQGKLLKGDILKYVTQNNLSIKPPRTGWCNLTIMYNVFMCSINSNLNIFLVPLPGESISPKSIIQTLVSRPEKGPGYVDIPLTGMRLTIAKRLTESKVNII